MALKIDPKLRKFVRSFVSLKRYNHCFRVAETALILAEKYGIDRERVILAAMLHDIAREMGKEEMRSWAAKFYNIEAIEQRYQVLLHGKAGAAVAREKFNVTDEEVLEAIMYHTTGKPGMTALGKILLIADTVEPKRKNVTQEFRKSVLESPLDEALTIVIKDQVNYLKEKNKPVADVTAALFVELTHGVNILET